MKFHFTADVIFEADNLSDAFARLGDHFEGLHNQVDASNDENYETHSELEFLGPGVMELEPVEPAH